MNKWYAVRIKAGGESAEVYIYGDIGDSWYAETVTAAEFVKEIAALDVAQLVVRINSVGGSVPDGLAIYNALKRHKATITTSIDGMALSIASLIAMAGDSVEMAENAMMMIHAPWTYAAGNAEQLREQAAVLDKWAAAMSTSYAAKTGKDAAEILALLTDGVDHYYTASEALESGLVDAVVSAMPVAASATLPRAALARFPSLQAQLAARESTAAAAATTTEKSTMKPEEKGGAPSAAATEDQINAAAAKAKTDALAADKTRRAGIATAFAKFAGVAGVVELQRKCEDDHECSVEAAGLKLLDHVGSKQTPTGAGYVVTVEDERDKFRAAGVIALRARAGFASAEERAGLRANPFRGHTLYDLARASLERGGFKVDGLDRMQIVAAAFTQSTSDFPVLLETTMHKVLQNAYAVAPNTWRRFCAVGTVSDFRAHNRYRTGSFGALDTVKENGEFKHKSVPDGEKASITAGTKGNIISLTRQMVINDDLGAFVGLSNSLGQAAARTVEADVYTTLLLNSGLGPTMSDGYALFDDTHHANVGTGAALSVAGIDADRVKMASQRDVSGNDYLQLTPAILLVPVGLGGLAREVNGQEYNDDANKQQRKPNVVRGLFRDVVDTPRLTGTRRYLFADPTIAPVFEVAFLDGAQDPFLEMQDGWDVDGTEYKVRLDYGVAGVDYRGAVTNAGA